MWKMIFFLRGVALGSYPSSNRMHEHDFVHKRYSTSSVYSARKPIDCHRYCSPWRRARNEKTKIVLVASTGMGAWVVQRGWLIVLLALSILATSTPFPSPSFHPLRFIHWRDWRGNSENICAPHCSRQHQCVSSVWRRFCTSAKAHWMSAVHTDRHLHWMCAAAAW